MADYCPHCRAYQDLRKTISFRAKKDRLIMINTYHCAQCHSFIKSEEDNGDFRKRIVEEYLKNED